MTLTELKTLFRKNLKVVPGGPPVGTPGQNRTAGVLAALDALAEALDSLPVGATIVRTDIAGAGLLLPLTWPARPGQVQEAAWYTIDGDWNATGNDTRVWVWGLSKDAFSPVGIFRDATGALSFVQVDVAAATAVPVQVDLSAYAKKQAVTGITGLLADLATTAKTNLVAAVNELAGRVKAKYYATTGQNADGAMTQKATTDALAGKLDIANAWPDLSNEVQIYANLPTNKITPGAANVFNGDVSRDLPEGNDPFTNASGLMYWRAIADTNLTFTKGTVDGASSLFIAAQDWVFLLGLGGRNSADRTWYVRMRGKVSGAGGGAGTVKSVNGVAPDASGDVALATTDRYDVPQAVRDAVLAGTFGSGELNGAQPAGSLAGQRFTTATYGYEYERGAGGGLVWCRYAKS